MSRLWHTVKYLKFKQIYYRAYYRLASSPIPFKTADYPVRKPFNDFVMGPRTSGSLNFDGTATFLNQTHSIKNPLIWNDPKIAKLWLYNLHYFDDLKSENRDDKLDFHKQFIDRWIKENPIEKQGNGWEPYPISLRLVNLIQYSLEGNPLDSRVIANMYQQAQTLFRRVEFHLLGNHLLANLKALLFSGLYFDSRESEKWLEKSMRLLSQEIDEQILSDGGHFERSPMYHAIIFCDFLDILSLLNAFGKHNEVKEKLSAVLPKMARWLSTMTEPSGQICHFNDSVKGIAAEPLALMEYYERLGFQKEKKPFGLIDFPNSGFTAFRGKRFSLFMDNGPPGPDYIPGHAHAETLSFELTVGERRALVNAGVSEYGIGQRRIAERGSSLHNCLTLNGKNSSDVWSGFRVGMRAKVTGRIVTSKGETFSIEAEHDGYKKMYGLGLHRRKINFAGSQIEILDILRLSKNCELELFFHAARGLAFKDQGKDVWELVDSKESILKILGPIGSQIRKENYLYAEGFGKLVSAYRLAIRMKVSGFIEIRTVIILA